MHKEENKVYLNEFANPFMTDKERDMIYPFYDDYGYYYLKENKMSFRVWATNIWFKHKTEILEITGKPCEYSAEVYFKMYKYWLKSKYKEEILNK